MLRIGSKAQAVRSWEAEAVRQEGTIFYGWSKKSIRRRAIADWKARRANIRWRERAGDYFADRPAHHGNNAQFKTLGRLAREIRRAFKGREMPEFTLSIVLSLERQHAAKMQSKDQPDG